MGGGDGGEGVGGCDGGGFVCAEIYTMNLAKMISISLDQ